MLRLIIQNGLLAGQEINLLRGERRFLTLGQGEGCDINFAGFSGDGLSPFHAMIVLDGDNFAIIDQGSTDGTYINGKRVESAWLRDRDIIELGRSGPRLQVVMLEIAMDERAGLAAAPD